MMVDEILIDRLSRTPQPATPNWGQRIAGYLMIVVGLMISLAVEPMLLNMRDSREVAGGIAGGIVVAVLLCAGIAFALEHRVPQSLMKVFLLLMGVMSMLVGAGTLLWIGYNLFVEEQPAFRCFVDQHQGFRLRYVLAPITCLAVGCKWIAGFFRNVVTDDEQ